MGVGHKGEAIFAKGPFKCPGKSDYTLGGHKRNELQPLRDLNDFLCSASTSVGISTKIAFKIVHIHP